MTVWRLTDRLALSSVRSSSIARTPSSKGDATAAWGVPERSTGPKLGNLQKFLLERIDLLTKALEQKAVTDFNDWLVRSS